MAYASWSVVFGEQPSAAKWNILGTNDAYFDGLVGSGTAWTSWNTTWTNLTEGNGVETAKYQQFGKSVKFRLGFVLGSGSSVGGAISFSLPVTSVSYSGTATVQPIGMVKIFDSSTGKRFNGHIYWATTTTARIKWFQVSGTAISDTDTDASNPMVWATSDEIYIEGFYEAA